MITLKGVEVLSRCRHVFVPKARMRSESVALSIAGRHVHPEAEIHEMVFPMTQDRAEVERRWKESARQVAVVLEKGEDACFLTLGDPLLFSTYIYLLRALRERSADLHAVTVPGIPTARRRAGSAHHVSRGKYRSLSISVWKSFVA